MYIDNRGIGEQIRERVTSHGERHGRPVHQHIDRPSFDVDWKSVIRLFSWKKVDNVGEF